MYKPKFRAWDEKQSRWITNYYDCYLDEYGDVCYLADGGYSGNYIKMVDAIPELFLGIQDKNYTDIFAGDIVLVNGNKYVIKWRGIGFWFVDNEGECFVFDPNVYIVEIIGNIHENPELF